MRRGRQVGGESVLVLHFEGEIPAGHRDHHADDCRWTAVSIHMIGLSLNLRY